MTEKHTQPLPTSPAAERNKAPILEVLRRNFPASGLVLETASGTGQHVAYFAARLPGLQWQPSDPDPEAVTVIGSRVRLAGSDNLRAPLRLDVRDHPWPVAAFDALLCINLLHISPWAATTALFQGAAAGLSGTGPILIYGPFMRDGAHTAPSNEAFDRQLRSRDSRWGIRDIHSVAEMAAGYGFRLTEVIPMPANNHCLVWHRA